MKREEFEKLEKELTYFKGFDLKYHLCGEQCDINEDYDYCIYEMTGNIVVISIYHEVLKINFNVYIDEELTYKEIEKTIKKEINNKIKKLKDTLSFLK